MTQAVPLVAEKAAPAGFRVVVAGWLGVELSGARDVVQRALGGQPRELATIMRDGDPHARVLIEPREPRPPRWPENALTHSIVDWSTPSRAAVQMQCADAELSWTGSADDVLEAEIQLDPDDSSAFTTALKLLTVMLGVVHKRRLLVHASAVQLHRHAVLFLGESEAGKSTTAERLQAEGLKRIADDALFVELGEVARVFPYFGDRAFDSPGDPGIPLWGSLELAKGADVSRVMGTTPGAGVWFRSLMVPAGPPPYADAVLDLVAALVRTPVWTFAAAPRGQLLPALVEGLSG